MYGYNIVYRTVQNIRQIICEYKTGYNRTLSNSSLRKLYAQKPAEPCGQVAPLLSE